MGALTLWGAHGLVSCTTQPDRTDVLITIIADNAINPNEDGTPSPVVLTIYELKGLVSFRKGKYFNFVDDDVALLGADLIGRAEYEMLPGQEQTYSKTLSSEATHIGILAGFRDISAAQWQDSIELKREGSNDFTVFITSLSVRIQKTRLSFPFG